MKNCILPLIIIFCLVQTSVFYTIRYVKPAATGSGDGSSWANASADLQAMINASASGDEVWVAAGVYKPLTDGSGNASPTDNQTKVFWMKDKVKLYGGFAGTETTLSQRNIANNKTILSGDLDGNDTNTDGNNISESYTEIQGSNSYQVMVIYNCDEGTELNGFIITGAAGTSTTSGHSSQNINGANIQPYYGAAINISAAFPLIENCVISGNHGFYGAIYQGNNSYTKTTKYNSVIFLGNDAQYGGSLYLHRGNTFVSNGVFYNNTSTYRGGAIGVSSNMSSSSRIDFINITAVNNYSSSSYKSLYFDKGIINLLNSIIYNSTPYTGGNIGIDEASVSTSYSLVQNAYNSGTWNNGYGVDGGNNYDLNPLFLDINSPAGADGKYFTSDDGFSLNSCSPAINTGANNSVSYPEVSGLDIVGNVKPYNSGTVDMGAYEFQGTSTLPSDASAVSSSSYSITCGQSVTLSGTCATGTLTWYDQASGGTSIGTGTGFVASPIENPTIYYAACETCETSATCVSLNRLAVPDIAVNLPSNPTGVSASENDTCPYTEVDLSATCSGGTSPEWYDGSMSVIGAGSPIQVSPSTTTTYFVKCKNGSCLSAAEEITVNVLARPINDYASPAYVCSSQSVTYTANCEVGTVEWYQSHSGGSPLATGNSYTFTPSHGSSNYYRLYVACSNGTCSSSRSSADSYFYFAAPAVTVSETSLCASNNTEITLTANCTSYAGGTVTNWYDAASGGNLLGTGNTFNHTPTSTMTYYAECVSNNYSCVSSRTASEEVVVGQPVSTPSSVSVNDTEVCVNTNITLSASCSSGTVVWYTQASGGSSIGSGQSLVHTVSASSSYYASCEDGSCISNRVATAEVTVLPSSGGIPTNQTLISNITGTDTKQAIEYIDATNKIINPANVVYESGKAINLAPGFEVENGSVFLGKADLVACP